MDTEVQHTLQKRRYNNSFRHDKPREATR